MVWQNTKVHNAKEEFELNCVPYYTTRYTLILWIFKMLFIMVIRYCVFVVFFLTVNCNQHHPHIHSLTQQQIPSIRILLLKKETLILNIS